MMLAHGWESVVVVLTDGRDDAEATGRIVQCFLLQSGKPATGSSAGASWQGAGRHAEHAFGMTILWSPRYWGPGCLFVASTVSGRLGMQYRSSRWQLICVK